MSDPVYVEPVKVIRSILKSEMELQDDQLILTNQAWEIPPDNRLYILISYAGPGKAIGNNNSVTSTDEDPNVPPVETQKVAMHHVIQLDLFSFGSDARTRKEEVIMALASVASRQAQEANTMQIARTPGPLNDTSSLEGVRMLNRYTMTVQTFSIKTKTKTPDYFTDFQGKFQTEEDAQAVDFDMTTNPTGG